MTSGRSLNALLGRLPPDYDLVRGRRGVLAVRAAYRSALLAAGMGPDGSSELGPSELTGRGPLGELRVGEERLVVRRFQHGGMFRWLSGERFADPTRPFVELELAAELERRGVATPLAVGAWAQRAAGFGWRLALVTRRVEQAADVESVLLRLRDDPREAVHAPLLFHAVGALVGRLHRIGFVHTDLTPRNLLVGDDLFAGGAARLWVLDLDRCHFEPALSAVQRQRVLARLLRFVVRRDVGGSRVLSRARIARFLRGYSSGLQGKQEGADEGWRHEWIAVDRLARQGSRLHRTGWAIEEFFGAHPERGRRRGSASERPS